MDGQWRAVPWGSCAGNPADYNAGVGFASTIQVRGKGYHTLIEKAAIVTAALGTLIAASGGASMMSDRSDGRVIGQSESKMYGWVTSRAFVRLKSKKPRGIEGLSNSALG